MNCRKVQSLISAHADSELPGIEMLAVRHHLSECQECGLEFESLLRTKRAFAGLRSKHPSHDLAGRICERLDEVYRPAHAQVLAALRKRLTIVPGKLRLAGVAMGIFAVLLMLQAGEMSRANYTSIPISSVEVGGFAEQNPALSFSTTPEAEASSLNAAFVSKSLARPWKPLEESGRPTDMTGSTRLLLVNY